MNKISVTIGLLAVVLIMGGAYLASKAKIPYSPIETSQMPVTSGENPQPGSSVHDLPVEPAAAKARKELALKLGVSEKSIVIMMIENKMWNDGCLGLGAPEESCLQALSEGFRVELLAHGKTYFYHTDKTGATIRSEAP